MKRTRLHIGKGSTLAAVLVLATSIFPSPSHAEDLSRTEQTVTVPGETPAMHFEFDDDNPNTPPLEVSANSIKNVTLKYGWDVTSPADVVIVIGNAKKCHPHSRINQLIKIGLTDADAALEGSISWQERDTNDDLVQKHEISFVNRVDQDGGSHDLSLCVR